MRNSIRYNTKLGHLYPFVASERKNMSDTSIASILPPYITAFTLIAGGGWAYWKFIRQRANEPATDIDIDVRFVGIQEGKWVIEITSFLKNQSLVRHKYEDFQVSVRYLKPEDEIKDGAENLSYQLHCPTTIDERIDGQKRLFSNVDYINPKQEFKHRYITFIPVNATFVWVQCKFSFKLKKDVKMNSQRIFRVPAGENVSSDKINCQNQT
jgi:cell division protein YceG involved in septum cleavage